MKNIIYILIIGIASFTFLTGAQSCSKTNGNNSVSAAENLNIPELMDRPILKGAETEYEDLHTRYQNAILALKNNPDDKNQYLTLASIFIAEARISGKSNYYNNAAMQMVNHVIERSAGDSENLYLALSMKSGILLSLHQFKDALNVAQNALTLNNRNATVYGALTDAQVELGNYNQAVEMCDIMLKIKPDIRSYARASYLRQIFGDNTGAIEAMQMAVAAGVPGMENTE
ncbi:MAG: tetratricopeptide repeat protein, partial [Chitinophagales bacterium]